MASVPVKHLEDITECSVCFESYTDPRVLPCLHTFCLQCIENHGKDKNPGDDISCPLCREKSAIPEGGICEFPKNFFMVKVIEVKGLARDLGDEDIFCDVCSNNAEMQKRGEGGRKRKAEVFCVECSKKMCKDCCWYHKQFGQQGSHKLIELDKGPLTAADLLVKFPETPCDKHKEESLKYYCFDCKTAVCMTCYVEGHSSHTCRDVKVVAGDLAAHLTTDAKGIEAKIGDCESMISKMDEEDRVLIDDVEMRKRKWMRKPRR